MSEAYVAAEILATVSGGLMTAEEILSIEYRDTQSRPFLKIHQYEPLPIAGSDAAQDLDRIDTTTRSDEGTRYYVQPHFDPVSFLIISYTEFEGHSDCLEVQDSMGQWKPVVVPPGSVVVLIGTALHEATRGSIPKTLHQVVGNSETRRISASFGVLPRLDSVTVTRPEKCVVFDREQVLRDVTYDNVCAHWALLSSIMADPLVPFKDQVYWEEQIVRYAQHQISHNAYLASAAAEDPPFPDPPRDIYYVWVVHMLQPKAYRDDCLAAFGRILPHTNHKPTFGAGTPQLTVDVPQLPGGHGCPMQPPPPYVDDTTPGPALASSCTPQEVCADTDSETASETSGALFGHQVVTMDDVHQLFPHIDWWRAFDGVHEIHEGIKTMVPLIADGNPAIIGKTIDYYCTFLQLCTLSDVPLAPGPAIDIVWHSHQCSPVAYNKQMRKLEEASGRCGGYVDHNPCGENNPADPEWETNTFRAWAAHLSCDVDTTIFPSAAFGAPWCCGCGAAPARSDGNDRPSTPPRPSTPTNSVVEACLKAAEVGKLEEVQKNVKLAWSRKKPLHATFKVSHLFSRISMMIILTRL